MSFVHVLLTVVALLSILCIIVVLFFERKNPSSSLVWVLVLTFLPVIGFVAYLFLGTGFRVNKRKRYALKAMNDEMYNRFIVKHLDLHDKPVVVDQHESYGRMLNYLKRQGEGFFTRDNAAKVYVEGTSMFTSLIEDIRHAKNHVHLLFYIFRNDELGREIVTVLTEKAKQGVEVRIMYDSMGSMLAYDPLFSSLKKAGGEVIAFSPLFSNLSSHLRLNYRNHRKIAVIDGRIGYVGGMNIGVEYMGRDRKLTPWRDTHLRLTGPAVWFLQERFLMDWSYALEGGPPHTDGTHFFPEPICEGDLGIQIISSGPDTFECPIKSGLLAMLYAARKNIYIQTPYFAPDQSFLDAMRIAAHSGVNVKLMIPRVSDYDIVHRATLGYARDVSEYGVEVYMFDGFIHSKTMTIDGHITTIGTTNITNRSFTLDFEVNAFIYDNDFAQGHEEIFHKDIESSIQVDRAYFRAKPYITRATYNFARLLAPMM